MTVEMVLWVVVVAEVAAFIYLLRELSIVVKSHDRINERIDDMRDLHWGLRSEFCDVTSALGLRKTQAEKSKWVKN